MPKDGHARVACIQLTIRREARLRLFRLSHTSPVCSQRVGSLSGLPALRRIRTNRSLRPTPIAWTRRPDSATRHFRAIRAAQSDAFHVPNKAGTSRVPGRLLIDRADQVSDSVGSTAARRTGRAVQVLGIDGSIYRIPRDVLAKHRVNQRNAWQFLINENTTPDGGSTTPSCESSGDTGHLRVPELTGLPG